MRLRTVLLALLVPLAAGASGPDFIPISAARQQGQGTVTVIGLVTVPSGDFRSSSGDEGFAIQDQTAGIWVSVKKNPGLRLGQKVWVTGTLNVSNGKLQIVPAESAGVKVLPGKDLRVATGQVGAATLGYLITVEGTINDQGVVKDEKYGWKLCVNDGSGPIQVYLNKSTDIDAHAPFLKPGRRLRVTGFSNIYAPAYEVDPRSRRDLVPLTGTATPPAGNCSF